MKHTIRTTVFAASIVLGGAVSAQTGTVRGLQGEALGPAGRPDLAVGGLWSTPLGQQTGVKVKRSSIYEVSLNRTGTGWSERFLIGLPQGGVQYAPVLVLFHGYGQEPDDLVAQTTFFQEAQARGWYVVAPLCAHKFSFSIEYAQRNVEFVMDWLMTHLPVDVDRFYGVGFSMGGGMAASYAARHQDPLNMRFAALVNHTGTASIGDVFWKANDKTLLSSKLMFGGTPDQQPFAYNRASTVDLHLLTGAVDTDTDMVRNLAHLPIRSFYALNDPNAYLREQSDRFHDQFQARGGSGQKLTSNAQQHHWNTLNETQTLNWLQQHTLQGPATGQLHRTLADRTGRWHGFHVTQSQAGEFTPFSWYAHVGRNRLYVLNTENLEQLSFQASAIGLSNSQPVEVIYGAADGQSVDIHIRGFSQAPTDVRRNGTSTGAWSWDSVTGTVTLHETSSASYPRWKVQP